EFFRAKLEYEVTTADGLAFLRSKYPQRKRPVGRRAASRQGPPLSLLPCGEGAAVPPLSYPTAAASDPAPASCTTSSTDFVARTIIGFDRYQIVDKPAADRTPATYQLMLNRALESALREKSLGHVQRRSAAPDALAPDPRMSHV